MSIPPQVLAQYSNVNSIANTAAQAPFQSYSSDPNAFVAPINAEQNVGIAGINSGANIYPAYGAAAAGTTAAGLVGAPAYNNAATGSLVGGTAQAAPYNGAATGAITSGLVGAQPYNNIAGALNLASAGAVNPQQLQIQQYMTPYLQNVLGPTEQYLLQQNAQQTSSYGGDAASSGAFGGDRYGVGAGNLARQQTLGNQQVIGGVLNDAYNNALGTAQQQQGVDLSAQQANRSALGSAASGLLGTGNTIFGQGTGAASGLLGVGNQIYGQGANTSTGLANLGNQVFGQGVQGGQALSNLGTTAQNNALTAGQAQLGAGTAQQQTSQAGLTALYNQFQQQQGYPFQVAQFLANIAEGTGALSGSTTTTTQPTSFFSDERLKENIRHVGKLRDGQKIYTYNYKDEPNVTRIGLIAQEVEKRHPEAVGESGGYKTVDYAKATARASRAAGGRDDEDRETPDDLIRKERRLYALGKISHPTLDLIMRHADRDDLPSLLRHTLGTYGMGGSHEHEPMLATGGPVDDDADWGEWLKRRRAMKDALIHKERARDEMRDTPPLEMHQILRLGESAPALLMHLLRSQLGDAAVGERHEESPGLHRGGRAHFDDGGGVYVPWQRSGLYGGDAVSGGPYGTALAANQNWKLMQPSDAPKPPQNAVGQGLDAITKADKLFDAGKEIYDGGSDVSHWIRRRNQSGSSGNPGTYGPDSEDDSGLAHGGLVRAARAAGGGMYDDGYVPDNSDNAPKSLPKPGDPPGQQQSGASKVGDLAKTGFDLFKLGSLIAAPFTGGASMAGMAMARGGLVRDGYATTGAVQPVDDSDDSIFDDLASAVSNVESGGKYDAVGPSTKGGDRAYGKYQVMGANIPSWSKEILGREYAPDEFLKDNDAQDKVARAKLGQYYTKYGNPSDAFASWFSGRPLAQSENAQDVTGTNTGQYVNKALSYLNKNRPQGEPGSAPSSGLVAPGDDAEQALVSQASTGLGDTSQARTGLVADDSQQKLGGLKGFWDKNEGWLVPAGKGLLTMLSSPSLYAGSAIGEGLGAALTGRFEMEQAKKAMQIKQQEANTSQLGQRINAMKYYTETATPIPDPSDPTKVGSYQLLNGTRVTPAQFSQMQNTIANGGGAGTPGSVLPILPAPTTGGQTAAPQPAAQTKQQPLSSDPQLNDLYTRYTQTLALAQQAATPQAQKNLAAQAEVIKGQIDQRTTVLTDTNTKKSALQLEAKVDAADKANTAIDQQNNVTQLLNDVYGPPDQNGMRSPVPRVKLGPGMPEFNEILGTAQAFGVDPSIIRAITQTNPADAQQVEKLAAELAAESAKSAIGSRVTQAEFGQFLNHTVPGVSLLDNAFKGLIEKIILPRAQNAINAYGSIQNMDPTQDDIISSLVKFRRENPWATGFSSHPTMGPSGKPPAGATHYSPSTGHYYDDKKNDLGPAN